MNVNKLIEAEYDMILDILRGGRLYGKPLNTDDITMLVVAAYNAGRYRGTQPLVDHVLEFRKGQQ